MKLNYIIEICVAIDIAILGIAYPIIIGAISNIGVKYNSNYLSEVFNDEFPQKKINPKYKLLNLSRFKFILYSTISSFIFLVFSFPPPPKTNIIFFDCIISIISNSADIIVFILTIVLVIFFIKLMNKILFYNGNPIKILKYIINKYNSFKEESIIKIYHLKTINEFAYYAINKSDKHLQWTLLKFYNREFSGIRRNHDKSKPLKYSNEHYEFVYNLIYELVNKEKVQLPTLENRAVSGLWLLGGGYDEKIIISYTTYSWLWKNLNLICEEEKYIKSYWGTAHQYFDSNLKIIPDIYGESGIQNKEEIKKREGEHNKFLEFSYALGGLLLHTKQYKSIGYILKYTQSSPPDYVLLPERMDDIFYWFGEFRNEFKKDGTLKYIDTEYSFPGLDNLGNSRQIIYRICSYITLLFIRQYSRIRYLTYQNFTSLPQLPEDVSKLYNWYDNLPFFKRCLNDILENKELLSETKYIYIVETKKEEFFEFLDKLKKKIKEKIGEIKLNAPLSDEKIKLFDEKTKETIKLAFNEYKDIFIPLGDDKVERTYLKLTPRSFTSLFPKLGFTDEGNVPDYSTFLADHIANGVIKKDIPNSFSVSATKRYLLNTDNIAEGINKLKINTNDFVIVAVNIDSTLKNKLKDYKSILREIHSTKRGMRNTLFILKKDNLPSIEHKSLPKEEIVKNKLKLIDGDDLKLYTSVGELNDEEEYNETDNSMNIEVKVNVSIAFISSIIWKIQAEVVQINIENKFIEQGIPDSINNVKPFKN